MTKFSKCLTLSDQTDDTIKCNTCKNIFHYYCAGFTESNFGKLSKNAKSRVMCPQCTISPNKQNKKSHQSMEEQLLEITNAMNYMNLQFEEFNKKKSILRSTN